MIGELGRRASRPGAVPARNCRIEGIQRGHRWTGCRCCLVVSGLIGDSSQSLPFVEACESKGIEKAKGGDIGPIVAVGHQTGSRGV
jgi:hypothetical protein